MPMWNNSNTWFSIIVSNGSLDLYADTLMIPFYLAGLRPAPQEPSSSLSHRIKRKKENPRPRGWVSRVTQRRREFTTDWVSNADDAHPLLRGWKPRNRNPELAKGWGLVIKQPSNNHQAIIKQKKEWEKDRVL